MLRVKYASPPRKKEETLHKTIGYVVYLDYVSHQQKYEQGVVYRSTDTSTRVCAYDHCPSISIYI